MPFASFSFLFCFLPLVLVLSHLMPRNLRIPFLCLVSFLFAALDSPLSFLLMAVCIGSDYLLSRPIFLYGKGSRRAQAALYFSAFKNLFFLVTGSVLAQVHSFAVPLGLSVYTLTSLGYLIDLYNEEIDYIFSFFEFGLFTCFFAKLPAGPLVSAREFVGQFRNLRLSRESFRDGFLIFCQGFSKLAVLSAGLQTIYSRLLSIPAADRSVIGCWATAVCGLFQVYYTFSGYSDLARGIGSFLGLELPANFHYPLSAESVSDFFSRFNVTVNRYVRKYVYGALAAEDNGLFTTALNIMLINMVMSLWYGIDLHFLAWGAVLGFFIILETFLGEARMERIPMLLRRIFTFAVVLVSFVFFLAPTLPQGMAFLKVMFGFAGAPLTDAYSIYVFSSDWLIPLAALLCCSRFIPFGLKNLEVRSPVVGRLAVTLLHLGCLAVSIAFLFA